MVSFNLQLVKMSFSVDHKTLHILLTAKSEKTSPTFRDATTGFLAKPASYPDVSLLMKMCAQRKAGRDNRRDVALPVVCTLPMVPCGSSQVTRFALASAMRKTKRLRKRLSRNDIQATTAKIRLFSSGLSQPFLHGRLLFFHIYLQQWLVFDMTIMKPELLDYKISL